MTATATEKKVTAKEAARKVLAKADGPLNVKVIAEKVVATKGVTLAGKTPEATIAAMLHVEAKKGNIFQKAGKGLFTLLPESAAATPNGKVIRDGKSTPEPEPTPAGDSGEADEQASS